MMGAGKTTVGQLVADRLGWDYLDSDAMVESATGSTVRQIFEALGEPAFRIEETAALERALSHPRPVVVSVAGGAVLDPVNRARLRDGGIVVWLRARLDTLVARVGDGAGRPLLAGDTPKALAALEAQRRPLYAEVATFGIDVDDRAPADISDEVVKVLEARS
jgi:shikimate kinase